MVGFLLLGIVPGSSYSSLYHSPGCRQANTERECGGRPQRRYREGAIVDPEEVRGLEEASERALADLLRQHLHDPVSPRVRHLMAKAVVAVLEAVLHDWDEDAR